jgi:hypothetical protein
MIAFFKIIIQIIFQIGFECCGNNEFNKNHDPGGLLSARSWIFTGATRDAAKEERIVRGKDCPFADFSRGVCDKKVGILRPLFGKEGRGEIFFERCYSENPPSSPFAKGGIFQNTLLLPSSSAKFVAHPFERVGLNFVCPVS